MKHVSPNDAHDLQLIIRYWICIPLNRVVAFWLSLFLPIVRKSRCKRTSSYIGVKGWFVSPRHVNAIESNACHMRGGILEPWNLWIVFKTERQKNFIFSCQVKTSADYRVSHLNRYISSIPQWQPVSGLESTSCSHKHYIAMSLHYSPFSPLQSVSDIHWESLKQIQTSSTINHVVLTLMFCVLLH